MRPRWRKVLSDLWDNKYRSLLVVASIAVGVFSVGTIAGAYVIISEDMSASYAAANPANIELWTTPFDEALIRSLENTKGVAEAEGRRIVDVRASIDGEEWTGLDLIAIQDFKEMNINRLTPVGGESSPGERELLLDKNTLDYLPVNVGDQLIIQLPDGTIREIQVSGIVQDQTTAAGDFMAAPLGFINFEDLEWLKQPKNYNRLFVTVSENPNDDGSIRGVSELVSNQLEKSYTQSYRTQFSRRNEHPMASTVQAALGVLMALGILMVLLSSSLIANTLNALLTQHLRQIGVMKLVGARGFQILGMYIVLILSFSAIAMLISIPLGGRAAYALANFMAVNINFKLLGYRMIPLSVVAQIIIAILAPLGAGFIPIRKGSQTKVRRAISGDPRGGGQHKSSWLDRLGIRSRWLSRPMLISIRNTFRSRGRLGLTLFTLTMGGAIFIAVFNVRESLEQHVNLISQYFLADVTIDFDRPYRLSEVKQTALQVPGVVVVEGWSFSSAEILNTDGKSLDNLQILAPPADSGLISPDLIEGRWILPGERNTLAVADSIWSLYPGLKPGDKLRLKIQGQEDDWTVVGIYQFVDREGILAYADYAYISELNNMSNQAFSYRVVTKRHDLEYQEYMTNLLDQHFRDAGYHLSEVEAGLNTMRTVSEAIDILVTFLLIMAMLTALVGSIGLAGTMGMNVLERTREIGVMRAIGAVDLEVTKTIIVEGSFIGMISWVFGAILSFPIGYLLLSIISVALFESPIKSAYTWQGFAIWLGVVLALSAIASFLPARSAAKLTIREVLAYE